MWYFKRLFLVGVLKKSVLEQIDLLDVVTEEWSVQVYEPTASVSTLFLQLHLCKASWKYPQMTSFIGIPMFTCI